MVCQLGRDPYPELYAIDIEPDSDPEFNAGTFVYEAKKKTKRGRKSSDASPPRESRKRRSDVPSGSRLNSAGEYT